MEKKILATFKLKRTKSRKKVIVNIDHTMSQGIASLARTFFCGKKVKGAIDYRHSETRINRKTSRFFFGDKFRNIYI